MAGPDPPDFIKFLFSEKPTFDCYFIVGKKTLVEPERVGAVKMMLMAHSVVFRSELEDSALKEKGDIAVKDIYPDTFRTLLKYIYGYDITGDLEFDEADNLLYAAEKYIMANLKNKLALRLMALLTPDNVCSLLNNPACANHLQLYTHVTKILRYETDKVLASPQFLEVCSTEGFLTILQQDGLAVPEIELWRAALKWAKHRGGSEDGQVLRQQLSECSKHLRLCTISGDQFCQEIVPAGVLNKDEVSLVCHSIGMKRKIDDLTEFNNEIEPRNRLNKNVKLCWRQGPVSDTEPEILKLVLSNHILMALNNRSSFTYNIHTKWNAIELLPLILMACDCERMQPERWTYEFECSIEIAKLIKPGVIADSPFKLTFSKEVEYGKTFEVPLADDGYNVVLLPNSKYSVRMTMSRNSCCCYARKKGHIYENNNMTLEVSLHPGQPFSYTPTMSLQYRLADSD